MNHWEAVSQPPSRGTDRPPSSQAYKAAFAWLADELLAMRTVMQSSLHKSGDVQAENAAELARMLRAAADKMEGVQA